MTTREALKKYTKIRAELAAERNATKMCWCAVIPFGDAEMALKGLKYIRKDTGYDGIVKEVEITPEENR